MSSQSRIEASRANGARSRGPATVEGKQRSARNAIRHGLLARTVVLADESPEEFRALVDSFVDRLQPADDVELGLVEQMAASWWRQSRSWAVETRIMETAAAGAPVQGPLERLTHAFTSLAAGPELALMHRYETRQSRMFQRALHSLLLLRKQNMPNEPNPIPEHGPELLPDPVTEPEAVPDPQPVPLAAAPEPPKHKPILLKPDSYLDFVADFRTRSS